MSRLKQWGRRWLLWLHGECAHPGCEEPSRRSPFSRCDRHEEQWWQEAGEQYRREVFEREVRVVEEGIRRAALPADEIEGRS